MRRVQRSFHTVLAALAIVTLAAGCGPKRPPASGAGGPAPQTTPSADTDVVDTGRDVQPFDSDSAIGADMTFSDASGEGGPLADIYYEYDQSGLTDAARATLAQHASWIKNHPGPRITVEGHCDERGTVEYNLALGDQRAQSARDYLVSLGVPGDRLAAISLGKERPLDPAHNETAWSRNRRAHFRVTR